MFWSEEKSKKITPMVSSSISAWAWDLIIFFKEPSREGLMKYIIELHFGKCRIQCLLSFIHNRPCLSRDISTSAALLSFFLWICVLSPTALWKSIAKLLKYPFNSPSRLFLLIGTGLFIQRGKWNLGKTTSTFTQHRAGWCDVCGKMISNAGIWWASKCSHSFSFLLLTDGVQKIVSVMFYARKKELDITITTWCQVTKH